MATVLGHVTPGSLVDANVMLQIAGCCKTLVPICQTAWCPSQKMIIL